MNNLNAYNLENFRKSFESTDLARNVKQDFDLLTWETNIPTLGFMGMTPREYRGKRIFSMVPFYYILQLASSSKIYDIGCGWNIYKKYIPNIIGIDSKSLNFYADQVGFVDDAFVKENTEKFENIMSMNALHFIPLSQFSNRINQVLQMTKPGGKIFIMMNVCHMIGAETTEIKNTASTYIRDQIEIFRDEILCFELDDTHIGSNMAEGTLRMVLQKHE
jgi:hypothetical protein